MPCCCLESAQSTAIPFCFSEVALVDVWGCHTGWAILPPPRKWVSGCAPLGWARSPLWKWLQPVFTHAWGKTARTYITTAPWLSFSGTLWHFEKLCASSEEVFGLFMGTNYISNTRNSELAGELQHCSDVLLELSQCRVFLRTLLLMLQPCIPLIQCRPDFQLFQVKALPLLRSWINCWRILTGEKLWIFIYTLS